MERDYRLDYASLDEQPEPRSGISPGKRSLTQNMPPRPLRPDGGAGQPLAADLRATFERSFGVDLSPVRVHVDGAADAMGAEAFAEGRDIHVAPRHYDPSSRAGAELLGHEVAHVLQQADGRVAATRQFRGRAVNDDPALEAEADAAGARAAAGQPAGLSTRGTLAGLSAGVAQGKFTRFSDIGTNRAGYKWQPHEATGNYVGSDTRVDGVRPRQTFEYFSTANDKQIVKAICLPPPAAAGRPNLLLPTELGGTDVLHNRLDLRTADEATLAAAQADAIAGGAKFPLAYEATAFYAAPHDPKVSARPSRVEVKVSIVDPQDGSTLDGPHTQTATFADDAKTNSASADPLDLSAGRSPATMKTTITWGPLHASGDGTSVTATLGPDHPLGSPPTDGVRTNSRFFTDATTDYKAGHLLNDHLGGPGNLVQNIAAVPAQINTRMSSEFEEPVKKFVNEQYGWGTFNVTTTTANDPNFTDEKWNPKAVDYVNSITASFQPIDLTGAAVGTPLSWNATIDTPSSHNPGRDQTKSASKGSKAKAAKSTPASTAVDGFAPAGGLGAPTVTSTPTVHDVVFPSKPQAGVVLDARQGMSAILESLHFSPAVYERAATQGIMDTLLAHLTPDAAITLALEQVETFDAWRQSFDVPADFTIKDLRDVLEPGLAALHVKAQAVQQLGASGIFEEAHQATQLQALLAPLDHLRGRLNAPLREVSSLPPAFKLADWFKSDRAMHLAPPLDRPVSPAHRTDEFVKALDEDKTNEPSLDALRTQGKGVTTGQVDALHVPVALTSTSTRTAALVTKIKACPKQGDQLFTELRTRLGGNPLQRNQLAGLIDAVTAADDTLLAKMVDAWLTSSSYSADALEAFTKHLAEIV